MEQQNSGQNADSSVDKEFIDSLEFSMEGLENEQKKVVPSDVDDLKEDTILTTSNVSQKIAEVKNRLDMIDDIRSTDEIEFLASEVITAGGRSFIESVADLKHDLMDIKTNQDKLLSELIRPMKLDGETTRGQLIGVQQENELIRHDIKSLQMQVDRLGEQGQKVDPGFMSELKAVGDTIEGLKNSIFMINKKIDMIDPDVRIGKIETKIKELILYLQQLTQTINARSTQQR